MAENSSKVADDSPKITSFEELKAYAEKNFPESFAKLPPASCYRVDDKVDHYREGPRLYVGEVIDGDEVHVLEPAFGYVDLYDILCLESPDDDELEERSIRFYEPFCWVFPVKGAETDSNTETYTYDLVLKSYIAYCQAMLGYLSSPHTFPENFISHFRTACDAVARGIENKRMMLGIGEQTGASMGEPDINTFENRMKQFTTEFDAFKSNHASDVKELNKVKAEKVELERRLDGTKVELEKANSQASMWQKKYEKLQNVMKDALGETT